MYASNELEKIDDNTLVLRMEQVDEKWADAANAGNVHIAKALAKEHGLLSAEWFRRYPSIEVEYKQAVTSENEQIILDNSWCVGLK